MPGTAKTLNLEKERLKVLAVSGACNSVLSNIVGNLKPLQALCLRGTLASWGAHVQRIANMPSPRWGSLSCTNCRCKLTAQLVHCHNLSGPFQKLCQDSCKVAASSDACEHEQVVLLSSSMHMHGDETAVLGC